IGTGALKYNEGAWTLGSNFNSAQNSTLILQGTNTWGGSTTINYGTLAAQNGNAIPDTSAVNFPTVQPSNTNGITTWACTLRLDASETVASLSGGYDDPQSVGT